MSVPENRAEEVVADVDLTEIEDSVSKFADSSKALVLVLDRISKVHSFIQSAVLAFYAVITLELNRKNYDRKVLVLGLQMSDMMSVFTHLRDTEDSNSEAPNSTTLKDQTDNLLLKAVQDIVAFGNLCDIYAKKSILVRAIRGHVYEERLAEFATIFANHRKQLDVVLSSFITSAPEAPAANTHRNDEIIEKRIMLLLFQKLSSPHEKEIMKYIAENGGMGCIDDDKILEQLATISTSKDPASAIREPRRQRTDQQALNKIRKELDVDVMENLRSNLVVFSRKLELQKKRARQEIDVMQELTNKRTSPSRQPIVVPTESGSWRSWSRPPRPIPQPRPAEPIIIEAPRPVVEAPRRNRAPRGPPPISRSRSPMHEIPVSWYRPRRSRSRSPRRRTPRLPVSRSRSPARIPVIIPAAQDRAERSRSRSHRRRAPRMPSSVSRSRSPMRVVPVVLSEAQYSPSSPPVAISVPQPGASRSRSRLPQAEILVPQRSSSRSRSRSPPAQISVPQHSPSMSRLPPAIISMPQHAHSRSRSSSPPLRRRRRAARAPSPVSRSRSPVHVPMMSPVQRSRSRSPPLRQRRRESRSSSRSRLYGVSPVRVPSIVPIRHHEGGRYRSRSPRIVSRRSSSSTRARERRSPARHHSPRRRYSPSPVIIPSRTHGRRSRSPRQYSPVIIPTHRLRARSRSSPSLRARRERPRRSPSPVRHRRSRSRSRSHRRSPSFVRHRRSRSRSRFRRRSPSLVRHSRSRSRPRSRRRPHSLVRYRRSRSRSRSHRSRSPVVLIRPQTSPVMPRRSHSLPSRGRSPTSRSRSPSYTARPHLHRRSRVFSRSPRSWRSSSPLRMPPLMVEKRRERKGWWNKTLKWFGTLGAKGPKSSSETHVVIPSPRPSRPRPPPRRPISSRSRTPPIHVHPHHPPSIPGSHSPRLTSGSGTPPIFHRPPVSPPHSEDDKSSVSLSQHSSVDSQEHALQEANHVVDMSTEVSKTHKLDKLEDHILNSPYYEIGKTAVLEDPDGVLAGARKVAEEALASLDIKAVDESIKAFAESSKVLMGALDELSKLHPFIAVAVLAFKGVVLLELKRRENDQKVIALQLLMQDMMWALLELRTVKDPKATDMNGVSLPGRMENVVKGVAKDITACGNACDTYSKKHLIVKVIKGPIYEARFAGFATTFADRRKELDLALSIYTALGINAVTNALVNVQHTVQGVEEKLLLLFHKLISPQEKEVMSHFKANGEGRCVDDDNVLREMVLLSQSPASSTLNVTQQDLSKSMPPIVDSVALENLRRELNEDVDESLERNMEEFKQALEAQTRQVVTELKEVVHTETERVITAIFALSKRLGYEDQIVIVTDDSLTDPDLHNIWIQMSWSSTVKAPDFVQALRDYFRESPKSGKIKSIAHVSSPKEEHNGLGHGDQWALQYISVPHMQPVLDTLDSTGSGVVGIPEANTLTASRPKDWSLPRWLAYWTLGWQFSVFDYRHKITAVIAKMFDNLNYVLPENRSMVDAYLGDSSFRRVELLLHSVHLYKPKLDSNAHNEILPYVQEEELRMEGNLQSVDYWIDEADTLALITGPGWIEWHIFPVFYLLLCHHLQIIKSSCKGVVENDEFTHATSSLSHVFEAARERIENIQSIYRHRTKEYLSDFAFGMFQLLGGDLLESDSASLSSTLHADGDDESAEGPDILALNFGPLGPEVDHTVYCVSDQEEAVPDLALSTSGFPRLEGVWTGHFPTLSGKMGGLMYVLITNSSYDGKLEGQGEDERGRFNVEGRVQSTGESKLEVLFTKDYESRNTVVHCQGHLDITTGTIRGVWNTDQNRGESSGSLHLGLTPIGFHRFRYVENHFPENRARARWAFACAAVLHQVQRQGWSWDFFKSRFAERRYFMELFERRELSRHGYASYDALTGQEIEALTRLECYLPPADQRFYRSLAQARVRRTCIHFNVVCTSCSRTIAGARVICLQCTTKDLKGHINLCLNCIDAMPMTREHVHEVKHTLIKVQRVLHDRQKPDVFRKVGFVTHRVQAVSDFLDDPEFTLEHSSDRMSRASGSTLFFGRCCNFCNRSISSPCWLCVECEKLICDSCDNKHMRCFFKDHDDSHALIRCKPTADRDTKLEKKLLGMHEQLGQLEKRFGDHQMAMNDRLTNMEELLRLVLAKLT